MKNISILIIISLFLICAAAVSAAPAEQDLVIPDSGAPGVSSSGGFGFWDFFRTLLVLAPGRMVQIIEVEGRRFLVGIADHSVQLLAELDKKEQKE